MRKLLVRAVLAIVAATSGVAIAEAAAPDPVIGTWQLNLSKSTFTPGPAFKSQVRTYSQSGQSITLVMKTVVADGKENTIQMTYQLIWPFGVNRREDNARDLAHEIRVWLGSAPDGERDARSL